MGMDHGTAPVRYAQAYADYMKDRDLARMIIYSSDCYARVTQELASDPKAYETVKEHLMDWADEIADESGKDATALLLQLAIIMAEPWNAVYGHVPTLYDEEYDRNLALPRPYPEPVYRSEVYAE